MFIVFYSNLLNLYVMIIMLQIICFKINQMLWGCSSGANPTTDSTTLGSVEKSGVLDENLGKSEPKI